MAGEEDAVIIKEGSNRVLSNVSLLLRQFILILGKNFLLQVIKQIIAVANSFKTTALFASVLYSHSAVHWQYIFFDVPHAFRLPLQCCMHWCMYIGNADILVESDYSIRE